MKSINNSGRSRRKAAPRSVKSKSGKVHLPRVIIGGTSSKAGKTVISIGLMRALKNRGYKVAPFKTGPDFIDPSYHLFATGRPSRNIDGYMMKKEDIIGAFHRNASDSDISIIEGTMGLYDSIDGIHDTGSTAQVSKFLKAPVILTANIERISRTAAPFVLGYKVFDRDVDIKGVILNRAGSKRHAGKAKDAVEKLVKMRVVGVMPRDARIEIPERHLGLVPAYEKKKIERLFDTLAELIEDYLDVDRIIKIANGAEPLKNVRESPLFSPKRRISANLGVVRDKSFSFYYEDNLDAFAAGGAEIRYIDSLKDRKLPDIDALYIGGGFPEVFSKELEKNKKLRGEIYEFCNSGKPVYAECGGLMYLGKSITTKENEEYEMVDFLPIKTRMFEKFQSLGYVKNEAIRDSPISRRGATIKGHEFHYSRVEPLKKLEYIYKVKRGKGIDGTSDGILKKNTVASYMHVHVLSYPPLVGNFLKTASEIA
ncbi:MAG: cobyrinate a,c-diamide synthase [Candidatus Hydrothermarchaeaceae archaeon]